jgi:hypothetical protein
MAARSRKQRPGAKKETGRGSKGSSGRKAARTSAQNAKRKPARRNSRKAVQNKPVAPQKPAQYELAQKALRMATQAHEHSGSPIARHETPHSPSSASALSERAPSSVPENPREQGDTANILQNTTNRRPGS